MTAHADKAVEQAYSQIAADYARRGYRVIRRGTPGSLPHFLRALQPDLIAERPGDHVVVEVKRTRSLRGANDLRELAEEIAQQPGWRLELVAPGKDADELAEVADPNWLNAAMRLPNSLIDEPAMRPYFVVYQCQLLETLLHGLAVTNHVRPRGKAPSRIAQELAFVGVIDQDILSRIEQIWRWRGAFLHGVSPPRGADETSEELSALCQDLHARLRNDAALPRGT